MKNNEIEIIIQLILVFLKVILKKIYIKRLMKLKSTIQILIMMKTSKNHYQF